MNRKASFKCFYNGIIGKIAHNATELTDTRNKGDSVGKNKNSRILSMPVLGKDLHTIRIGDGCIAQISAL